MSAVEVRQLDTGSTLNLKGEVTNEPHFTSDLWKGARQGTFAISLVLHVAAVAMVSALATRAVVSVRSPDISHAVTLVSPAPLMVTRAVPQAPKISAPSVRTPTVPIREPAQQPAAAREPELNLDAAKPPDIPMPSLPQHKPVPRQQVETGTFDPPKNTVVSTAKPAREVQTGGFGDPNGLAGEGKPNAPLTSATLGSFDLPAGPGAGNGNGGARGTRGMIASAGFGSGVTNSAPGPARPQKSIAEAGFTDATVVAEAPARSRPTTPRHTPVEIVYKPRPAYTSEARALRIEGEVLLEVVFRANGGLRVARVVSGLGHGLDDAAVQAAQRIRFRPATQDGQPCDSNATVHILFQLAQ